MIYLDHNATTPSIPAVIEAMLPYFNEKFGNASSINYPLAWQSDEAVKHTRNIIADYLGCISQEIIFTSGATESCNLAIKGVWEHYKTKGKHIITVATEHSAVLNTINALQKDGAIVDYINIDNDGKIDIDDFKNKINDQTILIAIMHTNNETGVIQDIAAIGKIAKAKNIFLLCDATQSFGKVPLNVDELGIDLLPFSAHKFYGPKGVGGLYVRRKSPRVNLKVQQTGGHQERDLRAGTLNTPGIVGMGKALAIMLADQEAYAAKMMHFQQALEIGLKSIYPQLKINGGSTERLFTTSNISFEGIKAERLISKLNHEIAFAVGSACNANQNKPSHVLTAMQLSDERIAGSIRLSYGLLNDEKQLNKIINLFDNAIKLL